MRRFGLLTALLLAAVPALGAELSGTVNVADRPAQYAVVWLEACGAPSATPPQKVVVD